MSKQETQEYEDARAERLRNAQRTGKYIDEFTTPLCFLTKEERLATASAAAKESLNRLLKRITDKRNQNATSKL